MRRLSSLWGMLWFSCTFSDLMPKPREEAIAAPTGWRVSLDFCGTRLADRRLPGDQVLSVGESSAASLVLPGLGGAKGLCDLTDGDWILYVPGLAGEVVLSGQLHRYADFMVEGQVRLQRGDNACLRLVAQPEIVLRLSLEDELHLGLTTRFGIADLVRQLALGGLVVALLALVVWSTEPVPEVEIEGDEEASQTSFELALFASLAELPAPERLTRIPEVPEFVVPVAKEINEVQEVQEVQEIKDPGNGLDPESSPMVEIEELEPAGDSMDVVGVLAEEGENASSGFGTNGIGFVGRAEDLYAVDEPETVDMLERIEDSAEESVRTAGITVLGTLDDESADESADVVLGGLVGTAVEPADEDPGEPQILGLLGPPSAENIESFTELFPEFFPDAPIPEIPLPSVLDDVDDVIGDVEPVRAQKIDGVLGGTQASLPTITCDDPKRVPKSDVDVVFVIDVSTTMGFMVNRVEQGIVEVDAMLQALSKRPRYGLVVFVDDVELTNGGRAFLSVAELRAELVRWRQFTASNRQIHSKGRNLDWPENSLDALHLAATGFAWRPVESTARLVVHATDDDFGEAPSVQSGVPVRHTYQETLHVLRENHVRVSSFSAKLGGECECLDVTRGLQSPFGQLPSLPDGTGGASFDLGSVASGQLSLEAALRATLGDALCEAPLPLSEPRAEPAVER